MASRFTELVIDCHDPGRLGPFWAELLDYEVHDMDLDGPQRYVHLRAPTGAGPVVLILATPDRKVSKNRIHIDLRATDRDQGAEVERILALGAQMVDIGQGDQSWTVMADPEGNEFCVLRSRVEPLGPAS